MGTAILIGLTVYFVVMGFLILGTYYVIEEQINLGKYEWYNRDEYRGNVKFVAVIWPIALVVSICVVVFTWICKLFRRT